MDPEEGEVRHLQNVAVYLSTWCYVQEDLNRHLVVYEKIVFLYDFRFSLQTCGI